MRRGIFYILIFFLSFLYGCGMSAHDYFLKGTNEMVQYNCSESTKDLKKAADMEFKDNGDWYPIYMLDLGLSRYYCNDFDGAMKAFMVVDKYAVLRSNRNFFKKGFEFLKSKGNRTYELTEREETLLHYYMGMIDYLQAKYNQALIEFKKVDYIAEGNYSKLPIIALMRGLTYEKLDDNGNALVAFKKIVKMNPNSPIGYILCYEKENNEGNKNYWKKQLLEKFKINVDSLINKGKRNITIIECQNKIDKKDNFFVYYNNNESKSYLFDVVDPKFNFSDFLVKGLKEVASKVLRDEVKNLASAIPGGGLVASLILGGDKQETRYWYKLPQFFVVDINYILPGEYKIRIDVDNNGEIVYSRKVTKFKNKNSDVFVINL